MMPEEYSRIFLLSHMRAFTSLTGHILGSNPAINGYYEMHLSYTDAAVLNKQLSELQKNERIKDNSRYLFDKLLHNEYQLVTEELGQVCLKLLVTLREPESTINSIVHLFTKKQNRPLYSSPKEAIRYYIERLEWLAHFCRTTKHNYYYFDAGLFKTAPQALLTTLSDWLELETSLSERYQIFSQTGKARIGDSSKYIHVGEIDNSRAPPPHIHIPENELKKAYEIYLDCRQQMIAHATDAKTL
jgi:hypothetical protein